MIEVYESDTPRGLEKDASGRYTQGEIYYNVFGAASEAAAVNAAGNVAPGYWEGMALKSITISETIGMNCFRCSATYAYDKAKNGSTPESSFAFDTGGGTRHLSHSLETVGIYPPTAPNYKGAIEWDGRRVNGIDTFAPVLNWSETHYFKPNRVTARYKRLLSELTGRVNATSFKGFEAGEVLFQGAQGARRGSGKDDYWEISFKFATSPNIRNMKVGEITVSEKFGWDYLWVKFEETIEEESSYIAPKPIGAYVERVYQFANLTQLGIGK